MEQSPTIEQTIKEQIIKYGTIGLDALITLIIPFLPPFIDKEDVRAIALLMLTVATPVLAVSGTMGLAEILSDVAVFGANTTVAAAKMGVQAATTSTQLAANIFIKQPLYMLSYPFRNKHKKSNQQLIQAISKKQLIDSKSDGHKFKQQLSKDASKVFMVIRSIESHSEKAAIKLVGSMNKNDSMAKILTYLKNKDKEIENQSVQFICNNNVINMTTKVKDLKINELGFVNLYYTKMQTFG